MADNYGSYTSRQLDGSEYGGVAETRNTVQPKGSDALTPGEILRLGYLVGDTSDTLNQDLTSLEDRRQMLGLKPAGNERPRWLAHTGRITEAELAGVEYPDETSFFGPEGPGGK